MEKVPKTGLKRDYTDKFYTKSNIAKECILDFEKYVTIDIDNDIFIEPSAGSGSFSNIMKSKYKNVDTYDIDPQLDYIKKENFIKMDKIHYIESQKPIHILGNPPFGRQSSLARSFVKECCKFATSISFILAKSFKKTSFQKAFSANYHLIYEKDLQKNSFLIDSRDYNVECVFQIWVKRDTNREIPKILVPKHYKFVKKDDNPHFSLRRVGVYAGKLDTEIDDKSVQSHYFIKLDKSDNLVSFKEKYNKIKFSFNNTVGAKSISKQEFIKELNSLLD